MGEPKRYFAWYVDDWYHNISETIEVLAENEEQAKEIARSYDYKRWDGGGEEPFDWIGLMAVSAERAERSNNGLLAELEEEVKEGKLL